MWVYLVFRSIQNKVTLQDTAVLAGRDDNIHVSSPGMIMDIYTPLGMRFTICPTPMHRITIMAETDASPTLSAYYDLTVKILDENDNAPAFSSDLYEVTVSEAVEPHTQLVQG